jgi:predicted enzyme related to lactoylglutathione lyase
MPTRDEAPTGAPCWVDLMTSAPDTSRAFYCELFGWTIDDPGPDYGGYQNFAKDGLWLAGSMQNTPEMQAPDAWNVYLAVEDAEKTVASATAAGGQVVVPAMAVHSLGSMAVVADTGGAVIGMWQPGDHKGSGIVYEPDAPVWFELHTRDYDKSLAFYRAVFGWHTRTEVDEPGFRYTTLVDGDTMLAGVMDASAWLPDGVPAHWSVYFGTTDADATIARAISLGATVVMPAEDTPYGRLATLADPTGAIFKLQQPPAG